MKYEEIKKRVRELRQNMTPAEKILWHELRNRKLDGKKFIRQHPLIYERDRNDFNFFILDFYCAEYKLVVELDGKIHETTVEYDKNRDETLKSKSLKILRIKNLW